MIFGSKFRGIFWTIQDRGFCKYSERVILASQYSHFLRKTLLRCLARFGKFVSEATKGFISDAWQIFKFVLATINSFRKSVTPFFISATLYSSSASVLLSFFINWSSNVALVLLNTYKHHHVEIISIYVHFYVIYFSFS